MYYLPEVSHRIYQKKLKSGGYIHEYFIVRVSKVFYLQESKKWHEEQGIAFEERHIVENNPTEEELREWHRKSGLPLKRFFNTSGMKYRELELKDKLPTMTEEEQYQLLATDGMLVKRPLLLGEDFAIPGFKENEWAKACALAE